MERIKNGLMNGYPNLIKNFKFLFGLETIEVFKVVWYQFHYSIPVSLFVSLVFTVLEVATEAKMNFQVMITGFLIMPFLLDMAVDKYKEKKND